MSLKLLVIITAVSLFVQVIVSLYYSVAIVNQNILINTQETNLDQLTTVNQQLEIRLATLNSLSNILEYSQNKPYIPITSSINLN